MRTVAAGHTHTHTHTHNCTNESTFYGRDFAYRSDLHIHSLSIGVAHSGDATLRREITSGDATLHRDTASGDATLHRDIKDRDATLHRDLIVEMQPSIET